MSGSAPPPSSPGSFAWRSGSSAMIASHLLAYLFTELHHDQAQRVRPGSTWAQAGAAGAEGKSWQGGG